MADLLTHTGAEFSPCRTWRYRLWRTWDPGAYPLVMLMLNPSTADEDRNDPTVARCERRARAGGFGGLVVLNIFAFRATDPKVMKAAPDPIGPANDAHLWRAFNMGVETRGNTRPHARRVYDPMICAGWGVHGAHLGRARAVSELARDAGVQLHCLGVTKDGQPGHPLYMRGDAQFLPWSAP